MSKEFIEVLRSRISAAESISMQYRSLFQSAYELALPQRNLYTMRTQGQAKMEKVFDSAGIKAVNGFVNRMTNSLTPAFTEWARLQAGPVIPTEQKTELNKVLEAATKISFSYINASNFSVASGEMYYDLAVGTGALLILDSDDINNPLSFSAIPTSELSLDEGKNGTIEGIFRNHKVTARGILRTWPDAKLTKDLTQILKDNPEQEVEFKEVTYFDSKDSLWRYEILFNLEDRIVERTFKVNPWIITRWSKIAGEVMGRGPLLQALPDLKMLNKGKEIAIRSAQLNVFGAYTVADDGITNPNTIRVTPNAMIPVARNGGPNGPSIAPLPRSGDLNAQNFMFEELKLGINQMMFDERLPPAAGPVRSATEIVERMKELQSDVGAAFGRLIFEFIQPLLQRVIHILEEKGLLILGEGINIDNLNITTQLLSPLAKTQGIEEVENLVQADQVMKQIDPSGELTNLTLNIEEVGTWISERLGVTPSLINTAEEKGLIKQAVAQAIQSQGGDEGLEATQPI